MRKSAHPTTIPVRYSSVVRNVGMVHNEVYRYSFNLSAGKFIYAPNRLICLVDLTMSC